MSRSRSRVAWLIRRVPGERLSNQAPTPQRTTTRTADHDGLPAATVSPSVGLRSVGRRSVSLTNRSVKGVSALHLLVEGANPTMLVEGDRDAGTRARQAATTVLGARLSAVVGTRRRKTRG